MARVAFVVTTCHEFEGIKALSATLKQHGHTSDCFITSEEKDFEGAVRDWRPDVVGIYATTGQERWCYPLIERWRRDLGHLKVVMGGPHPSFETDVLRDEEHVDATIKGEAEFAMLDLVNAWEANNPIGDILNIGVMRDGIPFQNMIRPIVQDLDTLPFPDVDIFYRYPFLRNKRVLQVHASRGCQNNCTYCTVPLMKKEWVSDRKKEKFNRTKSVDYLCEEMNDVLARYPGFRMVNFGDAALNMYRGWVEEFAEKWPKRVGLPFACNVNINYLNEDDIVALKRAGCVSVQFGLESGSEDVRLNVYKKGYTDEIVARIPKLLKKHQISFRTNNMMGSPAESLEDMFETVRANKRIKPEGCTVLIYRPFRSTVLGREDFATGRVDEGKDIGPSLHFDSQMKRDDLREVVNLQKLFNIAVYMPGGEALVRRLIRLPRNPIYDWTHLAFLWYQHAVVSGYGMADDLKLGLKNLGQIFGQRTGGAGGTGGNGADSGDSGMGVPIKNQFLETIDSGLDASH
ncbi:MAG: anaerobic magnesium-protoporphyrin IX monomethyl ester cyclase [Planctomycetota bacterium]|jgi:anaerobic magnesium-protoporphyrin IX monomethyl ester cyclase